MIGNSRKKKEKEGTKRKVRDKLDKSRFVGAKKITAEYAVSTPTLRRWANDGKLSFITTPGGKRLYESSKVRQLLEPNRIEETKTDRAKIAYARVSSSHQKEDLERQVQDLKRDFPEHEIVRDVGSGLNWNRQGFKTLLERCHAGLVSEIVVRHRDRLARFGVELLEWMFKKYQVKFVVLSGEHDEETKRSDVQELSEDLLSIVTVFVAKNNGRRAQENRRLRNAQQANRSLGETEEDEEQQGTKRKSKETKTNKQKAKKVKGGRRETQEIEKDD